MSGTSSIFDRAYNQGDLSAAVELARTAVKRLLLAGAFVDDSMAAAVELAGKDNWPAVPGDKAVPSDVMSRRVFAAFAMGIAVGQLIHPDVFRGGAR